VVELNKQGDIVWPLNSALPYEAKRFKMSDESTGGHNAQPLGLGAQQAKNAESDHPVTGNQKKGIAGGVWIGIKNLIPGRYMTAVMYILPPWMGVTELAALVVTILSLLVRTVTEWRWSSRSLPVPWPSQIERKQ
jgi:hypothetical protein